ncbi:MAG: DUF1501 domain-containing protein [Planctomycetia bacterium]|nr:DUF1501 domain-containing protein [Planctomycetia bacterium]
MLRLFGSRKTLCDGLSRRDLLHVGGLGALGLTLAQWLQLRDLRAEPSTPAPQHFGKAKSCILVFLFGSPPQHETFDPKPQAPAEIRGELGAIPTRVAGLNICELLPKVAAIADRLTIVRSLNHPYPLHGVAYALSGMPTYTPDIEAKPHDPSLWPFIGSVVDFVEHERSRGAPPAVPRNIGLPWPIGSKASDYPPLAGPYAAFLGRQFDPMWTNYSGQGSRVVPKLTDGQTHEVRDPFGGVLPGGKFELDGAAPLVGLGGDRFSARRLLVKQFDQARKWLDAHGDVATYDRQSQAAWSLLSSNRTREALDLAREDPKTIDRFGPTLFGQALVAARRLVEAGSKFVSVFWDPYGPFGGSVWDTHANHFPRLKEYLLPVFDQAFSAFIEDLDERGLLNETLVLCLSEHGRTPQIDNKPKGAGRHHWSRAYSAALAGGGIARGRVVGVTDPTGGDVVDTSVSPKDILATTLHLLGIDPALTLKDRLNRPVAMAGDGHVRTELLS